MITKTGDSRARGLIVAADAALPWQRRLAAGYAGTVAAVDC